MRKGIFLIVTILSFTVIRAQVEKGYWLAGGTLSINAGESPYEKIRLLSATPKIGYFLIDKLAAGLNIRFEVSSVKTKGTPGPPRVTTRISTGPLVRYYFLKNDLPVNVFTEGSLLFGKVMYSLGDDHGSFQYILNAGTNFFFTKSTALEITIGYQSTHYNEDTKFKYSSILVGIGFEAHLTKE
jgi:hypothetical protein